MGSGEVGWDNVISENLRRGRRNIRHLVSSLPKELPLSKTIFSNPLSKIVISGVRWDIFLFLCLWKGGWKRCFREGGREFSKGSLLSAMGREV